MVKRLFDRRDRWGNSPSVWIVAAIIFALPLVGSFLLKVRMDNNLDRWLATGDPDARTYSWYQEMFPQCDRVIVTWEGSTLEDPRTAMLVERLNGHVDADGVRRGQSPYVAGVMTAGDALQRLVGYDVAVEDAVERLGGTLIGQGWIKVRLTTAGEEQRARVERALERLGASLGVNVEFHPAMQPAVSSELIAAWSEEEVIESEPSTAPIETGTPALSPGLLSIPDHDLQISWEGYSSDSVAAQRFVAHAEELLGLATSEEPEGQRLVDKCFLATGSPLAMIVRLSDAGRADKHASVAAIREAAVAASIPEESLHMSGQPVVGSALDTAVAKSMWNPTVPAWAVHQKSAMALSGIVGIVLSFVFLRSIRLGLLVIGVSYLSSLLCVALLPATGTTLNMVLIVMPTLLMTLTLSGAIHVVNYWRHANQEHPDRAVQSALETASQPCIMAGLTTAVGLLSLTTSALLPVRQFGLYSAIGCVISLGIILLLLPALLEMLKLKARPIREREGRLWSTTGNWISGHRRIVYGLSLVLFVGCICGLCHFRTETRAIRYFSPESKVVQDYNYLEENVTGVTPIDTVIRFSPEAQQRLRFLQRMEIVRQVSDQLKAHADISGTTSLANFQPVSEAPAATAQRLTLIRYNRTSNEVERQIKEQLAQGAGEFLALPSQAYDLHATGDSLLSEPGDELWRIAAQTTVHSSDHASVLTAQMDELVRAETRYYPGVSHVVTGGVPLFLRTQQAVLESLIVSFAGAFVIIAGMMIFVLRDVRSGLVSMIPNLFPVGVVFGAIAWCGLPIDVGTLVTASVALGIAVDGTLHLITWFRDALRRGESRERAVVESLKHCGPALCQTTAVVSLGMLMLWPAELLLISRFGWIMSSLVFLALVGDIVLLPALLAGVLGALIENVVQRDKLRASRNIDVPDLTDSAQELDALTHVIPVSSSTSCPAPHFITTPDGVHSGRRNGTSGGMIDA